MPPKALTGVARSARSQASARRGVHRPRRRGWRA
jgi:hypothetical protein